MFAIIRHYVTECLQLQLILQKDIPAQPHTTTSVCVASIINPVDDSAWDEKSTIIERNENKKQKEK